MFEFPVFQLVSLPFLLSVFTSEEGLLSSATSEKTEPMRLPLPGVAGYFWLEEYQEDCSTTWKLHLEGSCCVLEYIWSHLFSRSPAAWEVPICVCMEQCPCSDVEVV